MPLEKKRRRARDVRRREARPVEDGEVRTGELLERRGQDLAARCGDVGLELVAEGRQTAGGKARDGGPLRSDLELVLADADFRSSAGSGDRRTQPGPVEIRDHARSYCEAERDEVRLAGAVVDDDHPDRAGPARARSLVVVRARAAGDERDRALERARGE